MAILNSDRKDLYEHFFIRIYADKEEWYIEQIAWYLEHELPSSPHSMYIELSGGSLNTISNATQDLLQDITTRFRDTHITIDCSFITPQTFFSYMVLQVLASKENCRVLLAFRGKIPEVLPPSNIGIRVAYSDLDVLIRQELWFNRVEHIELVYRASGLDHISWTQLIARLSPRFIPHSFHNFYLSNSHSPKKEGDEVDSVYMRAIFTNKPYKGLSFIPRKPARSVVSSSLSAHIYTCSCTIANDTIQLRYKARTIKGKEYLSFLILRSSQNKYGLRLDNTQLQFLSKYNYSLKAINAMLRREGYQGNNNLWMRKQSLWYNYCIPDFWRGEHVWS